MNTPPTAETMDEYISNFPRETKQRLEKIRVTIKKIAPDAEETISYGMPTFKLNKTYLVYFAGYQNHIGFYPAPVGIDAFKEELSAYKTGKGSVQFPLEKPLPLDLITRITKFRIAGIEEKATKKNS